VKTSERLIERLRREGQDLPPCTELRRTFRTRQTGAGAWSWFAYCPLALDDPEYGRHMDLHVGSHWPMSALVAAPRLTFQTLSCGDICVDPAEDDPPSDIWTVTKRHGEEMARVRGRDNDQAAAAARRIIAVQRYADAHGGFGLRRLRRSEAGPAADEDAGGDR
jgi:hypothetical protein